MRRRRQFLLLLLPLSLLALAGSACTPGPGRVEKEKKILAVTTLFPLYDFAKNVGGDRAEVTLLLPPGVEPHGFEPRPSDIMTLNRAAVFIYTSPAMEPWAEGILKGLRNKDLVIVDSSSGIPVHALSEGKQPRGRIPERHSHAIDPHIWLDFAFAVRMVENIRDGFITKDPASRDTYEKNAAAYIGELKRLDERYCSGLHHCRKNVIVHSGHFAFAYMAHRYGFRYVSVYGVSPNAEPTAADLAKVIKLIRDNGLNHLFHEELIHPRVAETLSRETGVHLLKLNAAGNITRDDFNRGETFLSLMDQNLEALKKGLQCR